MRLQRVTIVSVVMALLLSSVGLTSAGKLYFNRQCAPNQGSVPKHHYGHETRRFGATEFAVANAVVGEGVLRHKPFHFRATALRVYQLQLDQVGLAVYESEGKLVATGRITAGGGDGGLIGNNVTIRIRAYVASSADAARIPPDAVVVWSTERELWVSRGRPQYISLVRESESPAQSVKLKNQFAEITHLEVELEFTQDR